METNQLSLEGSKLPLLVKFVGIINIVMSCLLVLLFVRFYTGNIDSSDPLGFSAFILIPFFISVVIGIFLCLIPSIFLLRGRNWARKTLSIFSILSILGLIFARFFLFGFGGNPLSSRLDLREVFLQIIPVIILIIINLFTFCVLSINKRVNDHFKQK